MLSLIIEVKTGRSDTAVPLQADQPPVTPSPPDNLGIVYTVYSQLRNVYTVNRHLRNCVHC